MLLASEKNHTLHPKSSTTLGNMNREAREDPACLPQSPLAKFLLTRDSKKIIHLFSLMWSTQL